MGQKGLYRGLKLWRAELGRLWLPPRAFAGAGSKLGVRKPKLVMMPKSASPKPAKPMSEPRSHSGPRGVLGPKGAEAGYLRIAPKR